MTIRANHVESYIYRPATAADLGAIEALLRSYDLPTTGVAEALSDFLVAETQGRVIAVVGMEYRGAYGLLRSTAVEPAWRGRHIARKLVESAIDKAESRGVRALYLLTTTAEQWFPRFGFVRIERGALPDEIKATDEFRSACPASATAMERVSRRQAR